MTVPKVTEFTLSGLILAFSRAAILATTPSWVAFISLSFPPNVPNGVLLAPTIKTPVERQNVMSLM